MRRAPVDVKALVNTAPTTAGVAAAGRDPVFAAAAAADLVVVADPQLDRLARGVLLMALDGKSPSALLVTDMGERLGVGGGVSASFAIGPGLKTTTTSEFTRIATELGTGTRVRVGVAREIRDGQTFTFVAVAPTPLAIDTLERKRAPGETVTLTGNWHAPDRPLTFFADDGSGGVVSGDVGVDDKGAVTVSHTLPTTPGLVRLEFVSADDNDIEHNVYDLTFYVGDVPALVERVGEDTLDTASVITTINRLRGDRPYDVSPLLVEALLQPDRAAVRAHFARSKFLVRHQGQQTFTGVFSAAEFEAMALQSPSVRFRLASESTNAMGAVLEDRGSEGKTVRVFTAEVRDTIHVPTEQRRALDGINRARLRAKQKALVKDDAVEAALQAHVMKMCRGEATVSDQTALQVALDPVLRKRGYSSIATFLATGDDIPSTLWARNFAEVKRAEFNVAAVGACNGAHAVVGVQNAVAVVVVVGSR